MRTFGASRGSKVSFKNNLVYNYGPGTCQWPTKKVATAANTLVGMHGAGHPHDKRTSYKNPRLRAAGTGGNGFGSLRVQAEEPLEDAARGRDPLIRDEGLLRPHDRPEEATARCRRLIRT